MTHKIIKVDNYLLVVDDSDMVGNGYRLDIERMSIGIIDDDYFYNTRKHMFKKVIAHLPINDSRILEGVDLLPPYYRHLGHDIEDVVIDFKDDDLSAFSKGYNKAREKYKYTEEDMRKVIEMAREEELVLYTNNEYSHTYTESDIIASMNIRSLHQYPTEFECEMEYYYHSSTRYYHDAGFVKCDESQYNSIRRTIPECETKVEPKTITTAQGRQWVGKYK